MALACGNADIIPSNLRSAADEDRCGQFFDQHSRWNKKREKYRYAYEERRAEHERTRMDTRMRMDATRIELMRKDVHGREKH